MKKRDKQTLLYLLYRRVCIVLDISALRTAGKLSANCANLAYMPLASFNSNKFPSGSLK